MKILVLSLICTILSVSCGNNDPSNGPSNDASNDASNSISSSLYAEKLYGTWELRHFINIETGEESPSLVNFINPQSGFLETCLFKLEKDEFTLTRICVDPITNITTEVSVSSKYSITADEFEVHERRSKSIGMCEASVAPEKYKYSLSNDILILDESDLIRWKFIRRK